MVNILIILGSILFFGFYLLEMKREKLKLRVMIVISLASAIGFVLSLFEFISFPQGGGINLFAMLPIMVVSVLYGKGAGMTAGLVFGIIRLINGAYIINPAQFLLDYIICNMMFGLAGIIPGKKRTSLILGGLIAVGLSVSMNVLSGVVFFADYAPAEMNPFVYSLVYNLSTEGAEGILSLVIMNVVPLSFYSRLKGNSVDRA